MQDTLRNYFYYVLTETFHRSIIVSEHEVEGEKEGVVHVTPLTKDNFTEGDGLVYATLTPKGIEDLLSTKGNTISDIENVKNMILEKELDQLRSLLSYLTLEDKLKGGIVPITLRDGRVGTDEDMFRDTYSLPIDVMLNTLTSRGFRPIRTDTLEATTKVFRSDYSSYLFLNVDLKNIVTVFVNVDRRF